MANKGIGKIIGYGIAGVLTIGGASVVITHEDIAKEYKANTGKELTINEDDLFTYKEALIDAKETKTLMQGFYQEMDCVNYDYDFYASCDEVKASLKSLINTFDGNISCYEKLAKDTDLEKADLSDCISSARSMRDADKNFFMKMEGFCGEDCQSDIDNLEYNIAVFQAYLNK